MFERLDSSMAAVTIGEVTVDWLAEEPGQTLLDSGNFYRSPGGNASNVAIGLSRLGTAVRLIGRVGNDPHGSYLLSSLAREGVDLEYVFQDSSHPTAQCYVLTGADHEHSFYNWPQPNASQMLRPEDVSRQVFYGCQLLHATGISFTAEPRRSAVAKAIDLAAGESVTISFDAGFPTGEDLEARRSLESILTRVQILKVNYPELCFWSGGDSNASTESMALSLFHRYKPAVLAVTLGACGSLIVSAGRCLACPPFPVESAGGVGAGDGFMAGLIHALLKRAGERLKPEALHHISESDWCEIASFANATGALVTRHVSACEALPSEDEVAALKNRVLNRAD